mgnify:CR=1 FL=1
MKAPFWFSPACFRLTLFPIQDLQRCDQEIAAAKDALVDRANPRIEVEITATAGSAWLWRQTEAENAMV